MANNSTFLCSDQSSTMDDVEETRKGPWTYEEDMRLINYISFYGDGRWDALAKASGLKRTGKSCRLRWVNYLRPDLKRSRITPEEERLIIDLHRRLGNRWSRIAQCLPGRTDNEIKNFYRTHIKKKDSNSSSRVCRSGGGCIEDMETRALAFKKVCVDRDNAVAEHVKKKSMRFEEEDSEDPGVDTELKLCPQEIRSRETASSLADDSRVSLSCNTAGHNLQDPEEEQQQRLKHNLHSHAHTHSHAHSHTHADADSRVHYQSFVGSLTAIMSDFYNDGFHHYEPVAVDTVSCSLEENSSDDETFVDYSDELWNINSAGRPRIRKSEDH